MVSVQPPQCWQVCEHSLCLISVIKHVQLCLNRHIWINHRCMCMYLPHVWRCSCPDLITHTVEEPFWSPHPLEIYYIKSKSKLSKHNFFLYSFTTKPTAVPVRLGGFVFDSQLGHTKDYENAACCLCAWHSAGRVELAGLDRRAATALRSLRGPGVKCGGLILHPSGCDEQWDLNFTFNMFPSALALFPWGPNWMSLQDNGSCHTPKAKNKNFIFFFFTINKK